MDVTAEGSQPASTSPDWSQIQREILCPLCDYNLRGLIEPRCPECGHQFDWPEMLSPRQEMLPFLFEHRPDRNLWSFLTTLRKSLWSWGFWRTLSPVHILDVRRLMLFWVILTTAIMPVLVGASFWRALQLRQRIHNERLSSTAFITQNQNYYSPQIKQWGSIRAYVNVVTPMPSFWKLMTGQSRWDWQFSRYVVPTVVFNLSWPWLTLAALMIFRASLRQARVKFGHVLRCVIYSHGALMPLLVLVMLVAWLSPPGTSWNWFLTFINGRVLLLFVVASLVLTWRLGLAYRLYLRFPHAFRAVIASQVIVGLALFKAYLVWLGF